MYCLLISLFIIAYFIVIFQGEGYQSGWLQEGMVP